MSLWRSLRDRVVAARTARRLAENDAPADTGTARTRATGGVQDAGARDTHSTTGTTSSGDFVGRASGDDAGEAGTTGAERRADIERVRAEQDPSDEDR